MNLLSLSVVMNGLEQAVGIVKTAGKNITQRLFTHTGAVFFSSLESAVAFSRAP
jgi:hypothetical protein